MKIVVYAICKNERQFVQRWMQSMREADGVFVLDTGSEDGTAEALRRLGAEVTEERIEPWRFDTARNRSLELVPPDADVCVCTDLDEVFEPGWRQGVERAWHGGARQLRYRYLWSHLPDGSEGHVFFIEKIHARKGFAWVGPVHEVVQCVDGQAELRDAPGVTLHHYPDARKSRGQYLPLLELAVREDPENDRNLHYLGREYLFHGRWRECIDTLERHLGLAGANWADERCASMRFIARAHGELGAHAEALRWHLRAVAEAPHLREPYLDCAKALQARGDWVGVLWMTERALALRERPDSYICEGDAWSWLPHDLRALSLYHLGQGREALSEGREALRLAPWDDRLKENLRWYERAAGVAG